MVIVLETTSENRNQKTKYQCYVSGPNQKLHILQIFSKWIPLSEMLFILSFFSKLMGFPSLLLPFQQKCERTRLSRSACPSCALIVHHICCCWWSMCYNRLYKYIVQLHPVNQAKSTQDIAINISHLGQQNELHIRTSPFSQTEYYDPKCMHVMYPKHIS